MTQSKLCSSNIELPVPGQDALLQSEQLVDQIINMIEQQGGKIGFDEYMSSVLYQPGLGYYSAGSRKFGPEGDFITSPEISSIFSFCIARQCLEVIADTDQATILELGAGSGVMAKDIMLELERQDCLPEQYWILEVSADLKQRQQSLLKENIPHLYERFVWLNALPDESFSGVILANEVLDALPVKRFKKVSNSFKEIKVGFQNDEFCWLEDEFSNDSLKQLQEMEQCLSTNLPDQYISEFNFNLSNWLKAVVEHFNQGLILFIDYGFTRKEYYHQERANGTLLCHYRHRAHDDPFFYPGLQDITASVDFTALAETAHGTGLTVNGYTTQSYFLMACDLDELTSGMISMDIKEQTELAQQVRMLTMPSEMGEKFKVMALTKNFNKALKGFSVMDQRVRL